MKQSIFTGTVCCCYDGWNTRLVRTNGTVHIRAWLLDQTFHDFTVDTREVNITSGASPILFPVMDFSDFYINVEVIEKHIYFFTLDFFIMKLGLLLSYPHECLCFKI